MERNRRVINDERVKINVVEYYPPTPISPYGPQVAPFSLIARSIQQVFPSSIIAPGFQNKKFKLYHIIFSYYYFYDRSDFAGEH